MNRDEKNASRSDLDRLRTMAEERIRSEDRNRPAARIPDGDRAPDEDMLHELRTHRIELEMQNEELRRSQEELLDALGRYADLYDGAPVGYLTIDGTGVILEANRTAASMLGLDRGKLLGQHFSAFVTRSDMDSWFLYWKKLIEERDPLFVEFRTRHSIDDPFWINMESIVVETDDGTGFQVRAILSDVTGRKRIEKEQGNLQRQIYNA